jgi:hypothetical protein
MNIVLPSLLSPDCQEHQHRCENTTQFTRLHG